VFPKVRKNPWDVPNDDLPRETLTMSNDLVEILTLGNEK